MPGPTYLDFARLSNAAYDANAINVSGGWQQDWFGVIGTGFMGARYRRAGGASGQLEYVVAFAGTESAEDGLADAGFAGDSVVAFVIGAAVLGPVGAIGLLAAGRSRLTQQRMYATELARQGQFAAGSRGALYLTGHSLGGGLAQIVAAENGGKACTISAPTVSQLCAPRRRGCGTECARASRGSCSTATTPRRTHAACRARPRSPRRSWPASSHPVGSRSPASIRPEIPAREPGLLATMLAELEKRGVRYSARAEPID